MISVGDILPLAIEKPAAGGRMIARFDRLVVLVAGAIPGERVRARVERLGKGVAYATTIDVDEASEDRRVPPGDPLCGGCLYAHIAYARQLELKSLVIADALARIGGMRLGANVPVAASPGEGYRMRARLHLRGRLAGFFREGTHEICDPRQTGQFLPQTMDFIDRFVSVIRSIGVDAAGELELAESLDATRRVVHLAVPAGAFDERSLDQLAAIDGLTGLSSPGHERGDVYLLDSLATAGLPSVSLRRHVSSFFQGNRYLLEPLVAHVAGEIPVGTTLVDLYAGVGLFAVAAAVQRSARVTAVEGDRIAAADLAVNAAVADGAVIPVHRAVEDFVADIVAGRNGRGSGQRAINRTGSGPPVLPETIVVDPPRTGLSRGALEGICRIDAGRIVYISCDVATLARDARTLVVNGYAVDRLDAFDLFPNTPHIETVAVFSRSHA
jgi:23S rRNA (uracil1939-C5)-methyltransferase